MGWSRTYVSATGSWKTSSTDYSVGSAHPNSATRGRLLKKSAAQGSDLIEIRRPSQVNITAGPHFSTLLDACDGEYDDRNILAQSSALADSPGEWKCLKSVQPQTDEDQIGRENLGGDHRLFLIFCCAHLVTAGSEQSLY